MFIRASLCKAKIQNDSKDFCIIQLFRTLKSDMKHFIRIPDMTMKYQDIHIRS